MPSTQSLPAIIAHARSGALDHAWRLFRDAGLDRVTGDPAVLSLRGRLTKDQALGASSSDRRRLFLEAAAAYGAAGAISGASYPLINAASLALLAGDPEQARARATQLLTRLDAGGDDPDETPYYAAATRAEALLLLGETDQAREALTQAVALAPRAWEDHASTLRQFGLILAERGEDATWLEPLRPPRCLHFAGGMGLADGAAAGTIAAWLAQARIGFGFGALAAGADILVAEALVARQAQLHVVLPCPVDDFRRLSVTPYGQDWPVRFERLLGACDSLHVAGSACPEGDGPIAAQSLQLAAEVAMGRAVMQAAVLATSALQLLVRDGEAEAAGPSAPGGSAWMRQAWRKAGRASEVITLPLAGAYGAAATPAPAAPCELAAVLVLRPPGPTIDAAWMARLAMAVGTAPSPDRPPRWDDTGLVLTFDHPSAAAASALAATAALGEAVRVGAAYDLAQPIDDPFGGPSLLLGPALALAGRAVATAPPGAAHVTGDFAAALHAGPDAGRPRSEYVGDLSGTGLEDPVQLYALRPQTAPTR